jgi:tetratricopeptide (TPR) repeat protein
MTHFHPALEEAQRLLRSGDPAQAEQIYRQLVQTDPACLETRLALGLSLADRGANAEAAAAFQEVLRQQPEHADAHYFLGNALNALRRHGPAAEHFCEVLRLRPDHLEAQMNLGVSLAAQGRREDALAAFRRAADCHPTSAPAQHNLAVALGDVGRLDEALERFRQALRLRPDYAEAHGHLGNVLYRLGRRDEALAAFRQALVYQPEHADVLSDLGACLRELDRAAEGIPYLRQALRLRPRFPEAFNHLGLALTEAGRYGEAEGCFEEALRLYPRFVEAQSNLGNACKEQGRLAEALGHYDLALLLRPDDASAHWNRSLALLQQGDYERGWAEYEWRHKKHDAVRRVFPQPVWDGCTPLAGKTVLVWGEQGMGDVLQFCRYLALLAERGARVVLETMPRLVPLLATCRGAAQVLAEGEPLPPFDLHVPLLSLPHRFGTTLATVPAAVPYLAAEPALENKWRAYFQGIEECKVGLVWQGNRYHPWDKSRSAPLAAFAPLAEVDGVRLYSLQKGQGAAQLAAARFAVTELETPEDDRRGAFLDTAAAMTQLDLVVSTDTAAAHLAGALGVPVWVALSTRVDWRWVLDRDDSPWYAGLRLFRQPVPGDWRSVFEDMARALRRVFAGREPPAAVVIR